MGRRYSFIVIKRKQYKRYLQGKARIRSIEAAGREHGCWKLGKISADGYGL